MEEYKFNSENDYVPESESDDKEEATVAEPAPVIESTARVIYEDSDFLKPEKKSKFGKFLACFGIFILIAAISFASGLVGAHFMVEQRLDYIEECYSRKYDGIYADENTEYAGDSSDENGGISSGSDIDKGSEMQDGLTDDSLDTANSEDSYAIESIENSQEAANSIIEQVATIVNKQSSSSPYAAVAAAVKDSVVEITTEMASSSIFFQQFVQSGAGSGVIVSDDGYILTNNHVIDGATKIIVRLTSGEEFEATVIGADDQSDVAILKISADKKLTFAKIGDSSKLSVGEEVLAIGNPLGELGGSVTNGIISALDRELTIDGQTMRLLQTNAAINPGNSGGGLFNMNGELIAIVNAKSSGTGIEGLGFAIPINYAYDIAKKLLTVGYVSGRPAIGISYIEVSDYMDLFNYGVSSLGIYVYDGGETPLKNGDRIISFGDYEVSNSATLKNALQHYSVGDTVSVMVVRDGKFTTVEITLIENKPAETPKPKLEKQ